jgi:hypothetical protein
VVFSAIALETLSSSAIAIFLLIKL